MLLRAVIAVFAFALASSAAFSAQADLGPVIRVGDVVPGCSGAMCEVEVAASPLPGRSALITQSQVVSALASSGFGDHELRIPARKRIKRPGRTAKAEEVEVRIKEAVASVLPDGVSLENIGRVGDIDVPKRGYEVAARWTAGATFHRRTTVPVELLDEGTVFRSIPVSVQLIQEFEVPVALRDLPVGHVLTRDDFEMRLVSVEGRGGELAKDPADVLGKALEQPVRRDEPFVARHLEGVPVILRGERVTVISQVGAVRISASGVARQDGAVGERILAVVGSSSKRLWVEVTGPGAAVVSP